MPPTTPSLQMIAEATALAKFFHDTYGRLAPKYGCETRAASAVAWEELPEANRDLMIATCLVVIETIETDEGIPDVLLF